MRRIIAGLVVWLGVLGTQALATNLTFDFNNASCTGTAYQVGYKCTYDNVASNTKAEIELVDINNVRVDKFDDESLGVDEAFQPRVTKLNGSGWGYAEFEIRFYDQTTGAPVLLDFPATSVDVDGNGYSEKEGVAYLGIDSYTLEQSTKLGVSDLDADRLWYWFYAKTYAGLAGIDYTSSNAPKHMAHTDFRKRHAFRYRAYVYLRSGSSSSSRMFSAYFKDNYNGNSFPNWTNANTSTVGRLISGRVLEDVAGDGAISGDPGRNGVTVRLFKDDGTLLTESVTGTYGGEDGWYSFVAPAEERFVVTDARTLSPSSSFNTGFGLGDVWAEQTYGAGGGWGGALCDDDGDSNTAAQRNSSNGPCYGGRRGNTSDDASSLAAAEHVAQVLASNDDVTGVDFGFSFNVVTNTNDQDDDAGANRTAQGSLRQFIQNANAISGANAMHFVPTVPTNASGSNGGEWWHIDLALDSDNDGAVDILPPITDNGTTVDGTAYSFSDGTTRNTNPGTVGGDVDVGTGPDGIEGTGDEHHLASFDRPELEIQGHDAGDGAERRSAVISVSGDAGSSRVSGAEVANLAIYDQKSDNIGQAYNQAVYFYHVSGGSAHDMLLGVRADGTEPVDSEKINTGFVIEDATDTNVSRLYIAHTGTHGVAMGYQSGYRTDHITFSDLEIFDTGRESSWSDGFELQGTDNSLLKWSYIHDNHNTLAGAQYGASSVELWYGTTNSRIEECTLERADNHGVVVSNQTDLSYAPQSLNNVITRNVIRNNGGPGVLVALFSDSGDGDLGDEATKQIKISENAIYDNAGLGIDIIPSTSESNGDGVTPNDGTANNNQQNNGLDYPIFTKVALQTSGNNKTLELEGYVGTQSGTNYDGQTVTIEVFKADDDNNNNGEVEAGDGQSVPHGEGHWYIGTCNVTLGTNGTFSCALSVPDGITLNRGDYVTATSTDADGNTSEFGPNALVPVWLSGEIFEDIDGDVLADGDSNFSDNAGDQVARPNVKVYAFKDDGDGAPNAGDTLVASTTTDSNGAYSLGVPPNATYWVVVDSKTVSPSSGFNSGYDQGDVWAEQTYGPRGALCANPGGNNDPQELASAGPCYGGRRGAVSDSLPANLQTDAALSDNAEHLAKVAVVTSDASGLDFGFSFNVVTNVNDQDDDTNANRTAQGSLRQFIQNANAISGANAMRFVPAVPANAGGGSWWSTTLAMGAGSDGNYHYALPLITDNDTTIDGTAYSYQDGTSDLDTNSGVVNAPGPVGTSEVALDDFYKPEFEVNVNDWGIGMAIAANVSNVKIQHLAMYNAGAANSGGSESNTALVWARGGGNDSSVGNEVRDSFLGPRADGSDTAYSTDAVSNQQSRLGVVVDPHAQMDVTHNYLADVWSTGVALQGIGVVQQNFIEKVGSGAPCSDGVSVEQWSSKYERNRADVEVKQNYIQKVAAYGIESWKAPGAYTFAENTITETGQGDHSGNYCGDSTGANINESERGGIRVFGDGSLIEKNVIHDVPGHGIAVEPIDDNSESRFNTISQNSIYDNGGISIDLDQDQAHAGGTVNPNGDGVTANDGQEDSDMQNEGIDYPVFTSATVQVSGGQQTLNLSGYVGLHNDTGYGDEEMYIEVFKADNDPANQDGEIQQGDGKSVPHGEGRAYIGTCHQQLSNDGTFTCSLPVPNGLDLSEGSYITGTATDASNGNTSEFGPNLAVIAPSPYAGKVVINEVLYRQTGSGNSAAGNDEFIEIYNASDTDVDLSGWRLGDGNPIYGTTDGVNFTFPSGVILPAGAYAVIWVGECPSNQNEIPAYYQHCLGDSPQLLNSGDDIQLYDNLGGFVDYVAYGSSTSLNPPPLTGVWDDTDQARLGGAPKGQSISLTPNGQDSNTSKCWELTTSGHADGNCPNLPTIDTDTVVANGYERVTSVGVSNNGVQVSGQVYEDLQPNAIREAGEDWTNGTTVYVKLIDQGNSVVGVAQVDPGTGAYQFDAVVAGNYTLIVDDNGDTTDAEPNPPTGWLFINPDSGSRTVTVETSPVSGQDFGLFHGARVEGVVFRDTGDGTGAANDAVQNGDEPGVPNVTVSVSDGSHTRTATTDASGHYLLYVPAGWGNVTLSHGVRPATGYNTGGSGAHQAANWADASATNSSAASVDLGAASGISGQTLAGFNFGVVYKSSFRPDQQGSVTSPGTVTYAHTYKPGTQGTVSFSRASGDYTYQLRLDWNCDGDFDDGGEEWQTVSATDQPSFVVSDAWPRNPDGSFAACNVEVRALVPGGEPEGAVDIAQISASLTWSNNGNVADPASLTDTTTVRTNSTLQLEKVVRNVTQDPNSSFGTSAAGRPGDVLEYCIRYRNIGAEDVTQVAISDPVPFFADMVLGAYNGKDILWRDAAGATHELTAAADGDEGELDSGLVKVHAETTLQPGAGGEVCYRVELR